MSRTRRQPRRTESDTLDILLASMLGFATVVLAGMFVYGVVHFGVLL